MSAPPLWEFLWTKLSARCVHHEGRAAKCKAGVLYSSVTSHGRSPCISMEGVSCEKFQAPSEDQVRAEVNELVDALQKADQREADGCCIVCGTEIKSRKQVGRCIYAEPCGHRIGQGKA